MFSAPRHDLWKHFVDLALLERRIEQLQLRSFDRDLLKRYRG